MLTVTNHLPVRISHSGRYHCEPPQLCLRGSLSWRTAKRVFQVPHLLLDESCVARLGISLKTYACVYHIEFKSVEVFHGCISFLSWLNDWDY